MAEGSQDNSPQKSASIGSKISPELRKRYGAVRDTTNETLKAISSPDTIRRDRKIVSLSAEKQREKSLKDILTGLPNRELFEAELHHSVAQAKRYGDEFTLMYLDLDDLKLNNDRLGHKAGDDLLKMLAEIMKEEAREGVDICARFGGDEFAILLNKTKAEDAKNLAERIRQKFQAKGKSTVSIGLADYPLGENISAEELQERADIAIYNSKFDEIADDSKSSRKRVKNRVTTYKSGMTIPADQTAKAA